jgi:hypothetical protein
MNEDREGVVDTKLTIYHEADFQSKETIRGKLTKF